MSAAVKAKKSRPPAKAMTLPFGGSAVMEGRAGAVVEGDDPRTAMFRELNFFPTPPWAARAGGELVRMLDPEARTVWEPACGQGHMAGPLGETFPVVRASDVHDYGFGQSHDFLADGPHPGCAGALTAGAVDWVITNPPFARAAEFAGRGLKVARRGVALLCRLAFVESVGRYPFMRAKALQAPFSERVPMQLGSWDPDLSSATAYAWFFWLTPEALAASPFRPAIEAAWGMGCTLERLIPPGTCERLTRADDRVVYAGEAPSPQLELELVGCG